MGTQTVLDQNSSGTWRSQPGIKIWFEAAAGKLHFGDGSFWVMGSTSEGTEADSGAMYPTVMEDVNGNQIIVTYLPGAGLPSSAVNTSSRITSVEDTRAQNSVTPNAKCRATTLAGSPQGFHPSTLRLLAESRNRSQMAPGAARVKVSA